MLNIILALLGLIVILYCFVVTLTMGPMSFTAVLALGGLVLLAAGSLPLILKGGTVVWICRRVVMPLLLAVMAVMAVSEGFVLAGMAVRDSSPVDYTIVLGAGLRGDRVPLVLRTRLETALELEQGETIVVTGGQGPRETVTEASAMSGWLTERGLPEERIIPEDQSRNTRENLLNAAALIETDAGRPVGELRVRIVSSDFHCTRAKLLARRLGYGQVTAAGGKTPAILIPVNHVRESMALIKSLLFDW
ncbi:MAG: YdcF family protein [Oscillospiraceae bacterium]|nr:YdcF family protein [Oscillospiraceae bacterium]